jgi:hypothetical protein
MTRHSAAPFGFAGPAERRRSSPGIRRARPQPTKERVTVTASAMPAVADAAALRLIGLAFSAVAGAVTLLAFVSLMSNLGTS